MSTNYSPSTSVFNTFSVNLSTADYNALTSGTPGVIYTDQQSPGQPQKRWDSVGQTFVAVGGASAPIVITGGTAVGSLLTAAIAPGWVNTSGGWARDGVRISGAAALTYTTVAGDLNHTITYQSDSIPFYPTGILIGLTVTAPTITAALDTRPGWFAAPSTAATSGTAAFVAGRTDLVGSANGGKTGTVNPVTTTGSNYLWFAIANASAPTFTDQSGFPGGFTLTGFPFVDANSTTWYLYKSDYAGSYSAGNVTLS